MKKLSNLLYFCVLFIVVLGDSIMSEDDINDFKQWKARQGKEYENEDENTYKMNNWFANIRKIRKHNLDPSKTWKMGENQFTDLTDQQFSEMYLMKKNVILAERDLLEAKKGPDASSFPDTASETSSDKNQGNRNSDPDPTTATSQTTVSDVVGATLTAGQMVIDWGAQLSLPIKNQGSCGSCWAFAANADVEAGRQIKYPTLQYFNMSEQYLIDCCRNNAWCPYSSGCNGGNTREALNFIAAKGTVNSSVYGYRARTRTCIQQNSTYKIVDPVTPLNYINPAVSDFQLSLATKRFAVYLDATGWSSYAGGIFNSTSTTINHAVLLVGYDDTGVWKIKNSWGLSWGQRGYIRLAPGNTCGMLIYSGMSSNII